MDSYAIGIDLGTTFSCVGVVKGGKVYIIENDDGQKTTPSCVTFYEDEVLVGPNADQKAIAPIKSTIYDVKRFIGRGFYEEEVSSRKNKWNFEVVEQNNNPVIRVEINGKEKFFAPEEISAMVLTKMKLIAESFLGEDVKDAVITVPAYFNNTQRVATKNSAKIAGLNVLKIINEPTAAALCYNEKNRSETIQTVLIYDLGGGTLDIAIAELQNETTKILGTSGNLNIGGQDFTRVLTQYVMEEFCSRHGISVSELDSRAQRRVENSCEKAKRALSFAKKTSIQLDYLHKTHDLCLSIDRELFEALCSELFEGCMTQLSAILADTNLSKESIDEVVLVGGSTRIAKIQTLLVEYFGRKTKINRPVSPDEAVAYGAAVHAEHIRKTASLNNGKFPDIQFPSLIEGTSLSLGIKTKGGVMTKFIPRNSLFPIRVVKKFTTSEDFQKNVLIEIYEGERARAEENKLVAKFLLSDIELTPRGTPKIDVIFEIDVSGILNVTASEAFKNNLHSVNISEEKYNNFTEDTIKAVVDKAAELRYSDSEFLRTTKKRNRLENKIYRLKKILDDRSAYSYSGYTWVGLKALVEATESWLNCNIDASEEELDDKINQLGRPLQS